MAAMECHDKVEFISEGLIHTENQKIDQAVRDLLARSLNDDIFVPLHCMHFLLGRGYDAEIEKYCKQRLPRIKKAEETGYLQDILSRLGWTRLHVAIDRGDNRKLSELIRRGIAVNAAARNGRTPLHLAAEGGDLGAVRILVEAKATVDPKDKAGKTPVQDAAFQDHQAIVHYLVDRGAAVSDILTAASVGRVDVVKELLKAEPGRVAIVNRFKCTALHLAAREGHPAVGEALLMGKSPVNQTDPQGYTALHHASSKGDAAFIRVLLKHKVNVSAKQGRDDYQPIHFAAASGSKESVQLLLDAGADAKVEDTGLWFTPLHYAAAKGHAEVVELLIARNADVKAMDAEGRTPLHLAAECGQVAAVEALLQAKVPISLRQKNTDRTALHLAAMKDQADVLKALLAHGAAVDAIDSEGRSALHLAAEWGKLKAARALVAAKANVNLATTLGKDTPLHEAVRGGEVEMVKLLLAHKADPNARNEEGLTPYDLAKRREKKQLAELLRKAAKP